MKRFDERRIRQAEAAQLIILHSLYSTRESRDIIFRGGTAIRWFYGGVRFSEDLDFVTSLSRDRVASVVGSSTVQMQRQLIGNFGSGDFSLKEKRSRPMSYRAFVDFTPSTAKMKSSVKIEFEQLTPGMKPAFDRVILQGARAISGFIRSGDLRTLGSPLIVNVETPGEILSDKLRALMERPYAKGRDFFDIWFITRSLGAEVDVAGLENKLKMYEVPFSVSTPPSFYAELDRLKGRKKKTLTDEISADLSRFLNTGSLDALSENEFKELFEAVEEAFVKVMEAKYIDFSLYPQQKVKE